MAKHSTCLLQELGSKILVVSLLGRLIHSPGSGIAMASVVDANATGARAGLAPRAIVLGALGVVFGDIGTSPLYALREAAAAASPGGLSLATVLGVLSLILWSLVVVISIKYCLFILRADNHGEGGIIALLALLGVRRIQPGSWRIYLTKQRRAQDHSDVKRKRRTYRDALNADDGGHAWRRSPPRRNGSDPADHVKVAGEPTSAGCFIRSEFDRNPGIAHAVRAHMANAGEQQVQTVEG